MQSNQIVIDKWENFLAGFQVNKGGRKDNIRKQTLCMPSDMTGSGNNHQWMRSLNEK